MVVEFTTTQGQKQTLQFEIVVTAGNTAYFKEPELYIE